MSNRVARRALLIFFVLLFGNISLNGAFSVFYPISAAKGDDSAVIAENPESAENPDNAEKWVRVVPNDAGVPRALETAVVAFEGEGPNGEPVEVALVGAIHIAEAGYYDQINALFAEYDAVVFELVMPKGVDARATLAAQRNEEKRVSLSPLNAVSLAQQLLGNALGLKYQIDGIDYTAANMIRGDADVEDFLAKLISNGDLGRYVVDAVRKSVGELGLGQTEAIALALLVAKDKRAVLRRIVATQLDDEFDESAPDEKETALIHFRDRYAIDAARRALDAGKRKIAIFYGAAHMPDLARRLENEFGLKRGETRWLTAWKIGE
ncbi:MAG: hypothetical protein HUK22_04505 [Thermoguttaceae bacterium]|nr:hypothetical protein [Thermoguttaceae bacterium]